MRRGELFKSRDEEKIKGQESAANIHIVDSLKYGEVERCVGEGGSERRVGANSWQPPPLKKKKEKEKGSG